MLSKPNTETPGSATEKRCIHQAAKPGDLRTNLKPVSLKGAGLFRDTEEGWSEAWGAWGRETGGEEKGGSCLHSAQVQLSYMLHRGMCVQKMAFAFLTIFK